jgi:hypothetical protein
VPQLPAQAEASRDFVDITVSAELAPLFPEGAELPLTEDAAIRRALEEARYILGGMLYGFRFEYVPADRAREVEEQFSLDPVAQVPFGDEHLDVVDSSMADDELRAQVRYRLQDFQRARLRSWRSGAIAELATNGSADLWEGPEARRKAVENAIKQAVRSHLRSRTRNKPKRATGSVLFATEPRIYVDSGAYVAELRVKLRVKQVEPYSVF